MSRRHPSKGNDPKTSYPKNKSSFDYQNEEVNKGLGNNSGIQIGNELIQVDDQQQAQKYSNYTMATVLSTAENLTWRLLENDKDCLQYLREEYSRLNGYIKGKLIFNSYNTYNSGNEKSIQSLTNQFIFQIDNFSDDYKEFKTSYTNYKFPNNMQKTDVMSILDIWITALNYSNFAKNYIKYFISLKNIFQNIPEISYENEVREQYKGNPRSGKADPKVLQKEYANVVNILEKRTNNYDNFNIDLWK